MDLGETKDLAMVIVPWLDLGVFGKFPAEVHLGFLGSSRGVGLDTLVDGGGCHFPIVYHMCTQLISCVLFQVELASPWVLHELGF